MEKETLEEAAENYANIFTYPEDSDPYLDFINGAKWQQEISYSEEEVLLLLQKRDSHNITYPTTFNGGWLTPKEWFKQFKKK